MCFIIARSRIKKSIVPTSRKQLFRFLYREISYARGSFLAHAKSRRRSVRPKFINDCAGVFTSVRIKLTPGIESAAEPPRRGGDGECIRPRGCVPRANKSAGYTDGTVCTKPVLSAVSITADERRKHARLVGKLAPF